MSDLASPLLYVMEGDEAEAFWCFAALMDRTEGCFDETQSAVQAQLKALGSIIQVCVCVCVWWWWRWEGRGRHCLVPCV